jgi:DNA-binding NtrC family response regulator
MSNIPWERLGALPTLEQRNARYIRRVMRLCRGDVTAAALVLKLGRATLYRKVRELGIETQGERVERERMQRAIEMEARYGSR